MFSYVLEEEIKIQFPQLNFVPYLCHFQPSHVEDKLQNQEEWEIIEIDRSEVGPTRSVHLFRPSLTAKQSR